MAKRGDISLERKDKEQKEESMGEKERSQGKRKRDERERIGERKRQESILQSFFVSSSLPPLVYKSHLNRLMSKF